MIHDCTPSADRHRRCRPALAAIFFAASAGCASSPPPAAAAAPPPVPQLGLDKIDDLYAERCAGPEGLDDCAPGAFDATFREVLPSLIAQRDALVDGWLARAESGDASVAWGLAWAGDERAVTPLRRALLADRRFYGWESDDALALAARMRDEQYPTQCARRAAIEALTGLPAAEAVALTALERASLVREAFAEGEPGGPADAARWLLWTLAPGAFDPREPPSEGEPVASPAAPDLEGYIVAAHDSVGHHVLLLARVSDGRVRAVPQADGCRILPRSRILPTDPARARIRLSSRTFSNAANTCCSEVEDLAHGDFVAALGFSAAVEFVEPDDDARTLAEGMALEALLRLGAEPADFRGETTVSAIRIAGGVRVGVQARAFQRRVPPHRDEDAPAPEEPPDGTPACSTELCAIRRWDVDGPALSVVAVYDFAPGAAPVERLLVPSRPGGCSETEHDAVRLAGFAAIGTDESLVVVTRLACDQWDLELHATAPDGPRLVGRASGSAI